MGLPLWPVYGNADVGSAVKEVEKVIELIKSNKFVAIDLFKLYEANAELIKAILSNEIEN